MAEILGVTGRAPFAAARELDPAVPAEPASTPVHLPHSETTLTHTAHGPDTADIEDAAPMMGLPIAPLDLFADPIPPAPEPVAAPTTATSSDTAEVPMGMFGAFDALETPAEPSPSAPPPAEPLAPHAPTAQPTARGQIIDAEEDLEPAPQQGATTTEPTSPQPFTIPDDAGPFASVLAGMNMDPAPKPDPVQAVATNAPTTVAAPAPTRTRTPIIDAESNQPLPERPRMEYQPPENGRGWVLEEAKTILPPGVHSIDATDDPDPVPIARPDTRTNALSGYTGIPTTSRSTHAGPRGVDPRTFNPPTGALLAPGVAKETVATKIRDRIFTIDHTWLRYHPKRVLRYEVEAFVEGQVDTKKITGVYLVDCATRAVEQFDDWAASRTLREGTFDVPVEHKTNRIEPEKAHSIAMDHILESSAREVTMEDYDAQLDVIITQKRRIRAHRDDVTIQDEGLHWCPVWCFKGVNGEIEVDGLTGNVLHERLEQSAQETIIL